ncbi:thiamine pyrophosphate-requiring protein [Pigmentiphaga soli]|uniref:Thiamine pyrophosphate-requiring protein n=1 Tax=Pigmentiphaga soli TaxID=1007095 RepID=A0ABP8H9A4_9BURK
MPDTAVRSASCLLLEGLMELGVEYLFCNLGTDHAPLVEEIARWKREGRRHPRIVLCPHENTAIHMAGGYAQATGRAQAVLVHVDAGTANASMGLHNLARARLPILLIAGRAPFTLRGELPGSRDTYVHFIQEPFDQASVVRPYVKWEYTLQSPVVAKDVVARALTVAQSDPQGPVYLMLPREILAASCEAAAAPARSRPVRAAGLPAAAIADIAGRLLEARNPLLITSYAGRNPAAARALRELAEFAGIRVCEFSPIHLNIARESPCFAGYQSAKHLAGTDLGFLVDVDVPWIPQAAAPDPDTYWVQVDVDAVKRDIPMWDFPADQRFEADSAAFLRQLLDELQARATADFRSRAAARVEAFRLEHRRGLQAARDKAADPGEHDRIEPHALCAAIARMLGPDAIVVNEAIRNTPAVLEQMRFSDTGALIGLAGGGLGFSAGMALGCKLAQPERTVVQIVGDGSYYFCNPSSALAVARQYGLPIFTVVLDNSGWAAVKEATVRMYPDGVAQGSGEFASLLPPETDFAGLAASAGAHGELLRDPANIDAAVRRCLDAVAGGRSAVLHVRIPSL